jgi:hypothetical protein
MSHIHRRYRIVRAVRFLGMVLLLAGTRIARAEPAAGAEPPPGTVRSGSPAVDSHDGRDDTADAPRQSGLRIECFDRDPGWEGWNNRLMPKVAPTITQDFGYSTTNFAGKAKGEIGGRVQRSATPAYYADTIAPKTLNDKLTASGTFALRASAGTTGIFFGWFHSHQPGGSGRPIGSFGLDLDGEPSGARLAVRMINGSNKSCGTFITPFIPGKHRPTPIKNDGTRYTWTLNYDPQANAGQGRFQFTITSNSARPEEFEGKTFSVDLPPGFKQEGAALDRFGMMNLMKSGNALTIYFDDLAYDGKSEDFLQDPGWEGSGNRGTFANLMPAGAHDFGYSATNFAGGAAGEVGGILWRSGKYAYYADRVGPLTLEDRLEASGRVVLAVGGVDADTYLGWFNGADRDRPPTEAGHFLGVHVGGPTRVGHYFQPAVRTATGKKVHAAGGPVLAPGKVYNWSLVYDPAAESGLGAIRVTLGSESVTLALKRGQKRGVMLDRFGLFTPAIGGQAVKMYLDDLKYTATAVPAEPKPLAR